MVNAKILGSLPIFIAVNIAALLVWKLDISQWSMPLVLGIIAGGLVDLDDRLSGRLRNIFYTLIAFSISSLCAQMLINQGIFFILAMTVMTFVFTILGAVGQRYSTIAFGTLVVALYTTLTYLPETLWYINPVMILCGTLLYGIIAVIIHLLFPNRPVQESIVRSFLALADYLEAKSDFFDPDDIESLERKRIELAMKNNALTAAFNDSRHALFNRMRGQHRHSHTNKMLRFYFAAQDIHERANSSHVNYENLAAQLKNSDLIFRMQRLLELEAQACRDIANALRQNQNYQYNKRLERTVQGIAQSFELYAHANQGSQQENAVQAIRTLLENLQSIDWQLHHLEQSQHREERHEHAQIYTENISGLSNIATRIASHFTLNSQLFRHAIRLSIVVFVCCALVEIFHLQLERGYWILLTAIFVCQPNYSATKVRLKQRIIGTLLGVLVGSFLPYMASTLEAKLAIVVISSTLFYFFRSNNYSYSTFFITIQVLASFDIMGFNIYDATLPRFIDTLIGAALAWLAVSFITPDWKYLQLDKVTHQAILADGKYLLHIISHLQFGKGDDLQYRIARRHAHESATALNNTISTMNSEPKKYAAYLMKGFELVQLNSTLLGYISALGSYRHTMTELKQDTAFLSEFYPIAKMLIELLEQIDHIDSEKFNQQYQQIEMRLKNYTEINDGENRPHFAIPLQQLTMISQLLPSLHHLLR
ncbi:putative membrane protein (TIGR01666 family) [Pasteurella langaaensis DSM 22999]|uniref:Putative membrane protein (TIGR01666 family) n=1 Tax=Alitibacter langaaensis DSM 22999 TaxID=1122935 RepID=A0A2U0T8P5_9PAST|nr:YccS family putative transporter [Pasteurella langaaensis]PVX39884.1 putative membrane protein (TIGR01666 family) [Pasteurella langaaensis DSM 22999]